ncbi:DUF6275 family protein [Companilactobacillus paralimentarius]|uniref:DUF6275 family protein n=1 Tax=Companilactobacillus paralimentarius TaxID=83526 RepID=UPI003850F3EF
MKEKNMNEQEFVKACKEKVVEYTNKHVDKTDSTSIDESNVYTVWQCKTLQNNKALLSTTLPDGMYYEATYNGDKKELYLDAYKKFENVKYDFLVEGNNIFKLFRYLVNNYIEMSKDIDK